MRLHGRGDARLELRGARPAGGPGHAEQRPARTAGEWGRLVLRRWPVVLALLLAGLALGAAFTATQPTLYEAQTTLVLSPRSGTLDPNSSEDLPALAGTVSQLATSDPVLIDALQRYLQGSPDAAAAPSSATTDLRFMQDNVHARVPPGTSLVQIAGRAPTPTGATLLTAAAAESVIARVLGLGGGAAPVDPERGLSITPLGGPTGQGQVSPTPRRNLLLGGNLGLLLGLLAVALMSDRGLRLRRTGDIAQALGVSDVVALPGLAVAPGHDLLGEGMTVSTGDDAGEALRYLRSRVVAAAEAGRPVVSLLGPVPGWVTRGVALELGATLAAAGAGAIVVEADFGAARPHRGEARGRLARALQPPEAAPGLGEALEGADEADVIVEIAVTIARGAGEPASGRLAFMPAGRPPFDPSAALLSRRADALLEALAQRYRHVLIAGPPVERRVDSVTLAQRSDATLVLVPRGIFPEEARRLAASPEADPDRLLDFVVVGSRRYGAGAGSRSRR